MQSRTLVESDLKGAEYLSDLVVDVSLLLKQVRKEQYAKFSLELASQFHLSMAISL